ncbi:hypothetical protein ACIA8H_34605 [Streptomyces goshikiensis]|uniref:hypothetical protein n=1 Tax=Streptomyces goshikiensis TaxID=1942 RepID=UPI0033200B6A
MARDERFPCEHDGRYRGSDGGKQPTGGAQLLKNFFDELARLRADFERGLMGIEQALASPRFEQAAGV